MDNLTRRSTPRPSIPNVVAAIMAKGPVLEDVVANLVDCGVEVKAALFAISLAAERDVIEIKMISSTCGSVTTHQLLLSIATK